MKTIIALAVIILCGCTENSRYFTLVDETDGCHYTAYKSDGVMGTSFITPALDKDGRHIGCKK